MPSLSSELTNVVGGRMTIWDKILKAYANAIKSTQDIVMSNAYENCILGACNQYVMWEMLYKSTRQTIPGDISDTTIDDAQESGMEPENSRMSMADIVNKHFMSNTEYNPEHISIKNAVQASDVAVIAEKVKHEMLPTAATEAVGDEYRDTQNYLKSMMDKLDETMSEDSSLFVFANNALIINIGFMLLFHPETLNNEMVDNIIDDIREKQKKLRNVIRRLEAIAIHDDPGVESMINEFSNAGMSDYVNNIKQGHLEKMRDAASHAAALVNMGASAYRLLEPCLKKMEYIKAKGASVSGKYGEVLSWMSKQIADAQRKVDSAAKYATKAILDRVFALVGASSSIVDVMLGYKMQIMELERKAKDAVSNIKVMDGLSKDIVIDECPITAIISLETVKATANAVIRNMAMLPLMAVADGIIKPILEQMNDMQAAIQSVTDIVGAAAADMYKTISPVRWSNYVVAYQAKMMLERANSLYDMYGRLVTLLVSLKTYNISIDSKYDTLTEVIKAHILKLNKASVNYDKMVATNKSGYRYMRECIETLDSMISILVQRKPSDTDKIAIYSSMENVHKLTRLKARDKISDIYDGLISELYDGSLESVIREQAEKQILALGVYAEIILLVAGIDIRDDINKIADEIGNKK